MAGWWPWLLGTLVVLAGGAAAVAARRRPAGRGARPRSAPAGRTRPTGRTRPPATPARPNAAAPVAVRPRPGEIWWADVPYEDGTGSKVRPCLVLRTGRYGAEVLKITSQDKGNRTDHVRIPTQAWDPGADHDSYLDLTDPIPVAPAAFADRAGTCEPRLWREVQILHDLRPGARRRR
jgi:PemK-like, MazF-like toxin of type II toxin-antitoxin system